MPSMRTTSKLINPPHPMPSKSEERRVKAQTETPDEGLQSFSYPTLGGAVIRAKNQKEADEIAAKLNQDLKAQEQQPEA
jgi:hypothetical protein